MNGRLKKLLYPFFVFGLPPVFAEPSDSANIP